MRRIEDFVEERGLAGAIWWIVAGLGAAATILGVSAEGALGALLLAFALVAAVIFAAVAWRVRRRAKGLSDVDADRIVRLLRERVLDLAKAEWTYESVNARLSIRRGGHTSYTRTFRIRVTGDAPLHFLSVRTTGDRDLSRRQRKRITPLVTLGEEEGRGRIPFQAEWESPRKLEVWIYLPEPKPANSTVSFSIHVDWPGLFPGLANKQTEPIHWSQIHPVEALTYEIILEKSLKRRTPLGVTTEGVPPPTQEPLDGSWRVRGEVKNLKVGSKVGITLDAR